MSGDFDEMFQSKAGGSWAHRVAEPQVDAPDEGEQAVGSGPYKPYGFTPSQDLETCDITWWLKGQIPRGQEIQYRFLVRVGYLGDEDLQLMLTDCIIHIEGKNLRDLRKRLTRRRVTFIQAFNPTVWPQLPPEGEPLIERISILYPSGPGDTQQ
jgi:hypothetical protein